MDPSLRASLLAGMAAGIAGLVCFTLLHVLLVAPLWIFLAIGFVPAVLGGALAGWAWHELRATGQLPAGFAGGAGFGALLWLTLVPLELVALVRGPIAGVNPMTAMRALPSEVVLAPLAGALFAWILTRRARPALAVALAALALALPVSGTLVALGASSLGPAIFLGMLLVDLAAGLTLVATRSKLAREETVKPSASS